MSKAFHSGGRGMRVPVLHNMSAPPQTTVNYRTRPVYRSVLVSLRHWLYYRKQFGGPQKKTKRPIEFTRSSSGDAVLKGLGKLGTTSDSANAAAGQVRGVLIGSGGRLGAYPGVKEDNLLGEERRFVCDDLDLVAGVLSRVVGNMYLSSRSPDYSWEAILKSYFIVDDPRVTGVRVHARGT